MHKGNHRDMQKKYREQIKRFRLMDDNFMTAVFSHSKEAVQKVLRIILQKPDLAVVEVRVQDEKHSLRGHSVRLDVHAVDSDGTHYDIEIQRSDSGAAPKRARFNLSLLDAENLDKKLDYRKLPETYIIFITERDVLGCGLPMYHIERRVEETGELFGDESHIIYVNGEYQARDAIGLLMADFRTADPAQMHYEELAEPARYLKGTEEGVQSMCRSIEKLVEEGRQEGRQEGREEVYEEIVRKLKETMTAEQIAEVVRLPVERVLTLLNA